MDGEDVGYFYGTGLKDKAWERFERGIFRTKGEAIITRMKEGYQQRTEKINKVLRAEIYNSPSRPSMDGGQPGSMDAMGIGIAKGMPATREKTDWPKQSAFVDIMSVWRQKDRPQAQWTASMTHTLYRNLGAELGVIGVPEETNLENSVRTSRFLNELPSPPYPFTVRKSLADKGKALFDKNCQSCHKAGTTEIYPPQDVGTDPNRVAVFNDATRGDLIAGLRKACPDKKICAGVPDDSILKKETGYMAVPLDGIWARAPYLHNGSVPTLRHLLVPELREEANAKTFWRGNPDYDQKNVGWVWDQQKMPTAKRYSTSLEGNSNKGHDAGRYLRSDGKGRWEGEELEALLEYLKTL